MALPINGNIYTFRCAASSTRLLNLFYQNGIKNGQNVCLWGKDGSLEQQWKYSNGKLLSMRGTGFALDKYTVTGNALNNNADIWTANDDVNQKIVFESVSGNTVRIRLASSQLYLTAYSDADCNVITPTKLGIAGNVYWAAKNNSSFQQWVFTKVGGDSNTGKYFWPTESHTLSTKGGYGGGHKGIDIRAVNIGVAGDKIYAFTDGYVSKITTANMNDGNGVRIHHINPYPSKTNNKKQLRTQYLHMRDVPLVKAGDTVKGGQLIGYMGTTGNSTGVHLHFETRVSDTEFPMNGSVVSDYNQGTIVDPMIYVGSLQ